MVKRQVAGATLMEFIIYFSMLIIITSVCFSLITYVYIPMIRISKQNNKIIELHSGLIQFFRDGANAPSDYAQWKKISPTELIWHSPAGYDIGWSYHKNKLERKEGIYSALHNRWEKSVKGLITAEMTASSFMVEKKQNMVTRISLSYTLGQHDGTQAITFRNKKIEGNKI